jgi:hypothetical protein
MHLDFEASKLVLIVVPCLNFKKGIAFRLSGLLRVNCKAKLQVTCHLTRGSKNGFPGKIR